VKSSYKVVVEEIPGPLQQNGVRNDLNMVVVSCDSEPLTKLSLRA
jgi:hypothetical protein